MPYQYRKLKLKNGKTIDEHRQVMQNHLGRTLRKDEVVHHKDGNKMNNALDNLEVMSLAEHSRMHATGRMALPGQRAKQRQHGLARRAKHSKLNEAQVAVIKRRIAAGDHLSVIAGDYGVTPRVIRGIAKGWAWTDVAMAA